MTQLNKSSKHSTPVLVLIFIFISILSTAQNSGVVVDGKSNMPLMGVNVYSSIIGTLAVTNADGSFTLRNPAKMNSNDTLCFSYIGYVTKKISIKELNTMKNVVSLYEDIQLLNGVVIIKDQSKLQHELRFKKLASLKDGIYSFGSALYDGKICVIRGDTSFGDDPVLKTLTDNGDDFLQHLKPTTLWQKFSGHVYVYDTKTNKWIKGKPELEKKAYNSMNYYQGKMFVVEGKNLSKDGLTEYQDDKSEVYDIAKNRILANHTNPHQAINFASFMYHDNLIVMGGSLKINAGVEKEYSNKVHDCNLKTGQWYELQDMPVGMETKGILKGNSVYLFGGYRNKPLKQIETYNVITGKWNQEGVLPFAVNRPGISISKNIIYIFENGKIQTYNTDTKEINVYLIDLVLNSVELFCTGNMLYVLDGKYTDRYSVTPSSDLYSIDLNEFKKTKTYPVEDEK